MSHSVQLATLQNTKMVVVSSENVKCCFSLSNLLNSQRLQMVPPPPPPPPPKKKEQMHLLVLIINTYPLVLSLCFQWKRMWKKQMPRWHNSRKKLKSCEFWMPRQPRICVSYPHSIQSVSPNTQPIASRSVFFVLPSKEVTFVSKELSF